MAVGLAAALSCLALIQVLAFVLNILPVPGLDGFGVLEPFLSPQARLLAAKVAAVGAAGAAGGAAGPAGGVGGAVRDRATCCSA